VLDENLGQWGAVEALGTAGAMASSRVGAIFALPPVVGAIVAVFALGCRMSVPSCNGRRRRCRRKR
jgi:hypothetical protein